METIDDETSAAAIEYMQRQANSEHPFFVWFNAAHMFARSIAGATSMATVNT
jgi:hypothetical protein